MPCSTDSFASASVIADKAAGAFELDSNLATMGGYACLAAGSALALGVGAAVAPAPVLGLTALGGGLVVAGNIEDVKAVFKGSAPVAVSPLRDPSAADPTDGGKYATVDELAAEAKPVSTQEAVTIA